MGQVLQRGATTTEAVCRVAPEDRPETDPPCSLSTCVHGTVGGCRKYVRTFFPTQAQLPGGLVHAQPLMMPLLDLYKALQSPHSDPSWARMPMLGYIWGFLNRRI